MKTYDRVINFSLMILFFAGLAFSDMIEASSSAKYADDMSGKKDLVGCMKEDVDAIQGKIIFRKTLCGPVGLKIEPKDISEMIPPAAKPVLDTPRMMGTLQPESCYTVPVSEEKK